MNIETKYKIVEKIIQTDDDLLLNEIHILLGLRDYDFRQDLPRDVQESLKQAHQELDQGLGIDHDQVMASVKKQYLNK